MKTIYSTTAAESSDPARISVLQNTLSQLRLANIATLDALMTHFTRLIELTSADETYISSLRTTLAPCILRPKTETSMTMEEKCSYRLIRDLFTHKDAIFSELKRASSLAHSTSIDTRRPRAISTDESNRKANMEARARAIISAGGSSKSRATSPAPSPRGHRRDRSSGGPETRFPIATSVTSPISNDHARAPRAAVQSAMRQSLEVPAESAPPAAPVESTNGTAPASNSLRDITNGSAEPAPANVTSATYMPGMDDDMHEIGIEKRNSLGRSGAKFTGRRPVGLARMSQDHLTSSNRDSVGSLTGVHEHHDHGRVGVSLEDKPMDD
jgi:hypothetical protein